MSQKRKDSRSGAQASIVDSATLSAQAALALRSSRYKEAIELYKDLLRSDAQPAWRENLALAYAGRAEDLAAKGLVKEAMALWRTRAGACGVPLVDGPYVGWLVEAGETEQALRLLTSAAGLTPEARATLEYQLAGAALLAADKDLVALAADSPLLHHRGSAQAALAAFARGDDATMDEHLQAIPYRSPYRDLRAILRSLTGFATDAGEASAALVRVPRESPFEHLAAVARGGTPAGPRGFAALGGLTEEARALALDLAGCPVRQRSLVRELLALADGRAAPAALFDLVERYRGVLPEGAAARLCRSLLPQAPERLKAYARSFGALSAIEHERTLALAAEVKNRDELAEDHWRRVASCLKAQPTDHYRAAMVLRHLADNVHHCARDGTPCPDVLAWWAESLEFDPTDRATHLKLIRAARARADAKEARARLDAALTRFPDDPEVLLEAVEAALANGAFKKAAGIAKRVQELDPINPRVRSVIGQAHVSHARKQIVADNVQAARRELDEAARWLRAPTDLGSIKLLRGLIEETAASGDALLREGMADLGGGLVGPFLLLLECGRTKRDAESLMRRAGADLAGAPRADQVVALAHILNAARDDAKVLRTALDPLRPLLRRAAALPFDETDHRLVCEALHRHGEGDLVRAHAEAALGRWPGRPVFVYLKASAVHGNTPWRLPQRDAMALEQALDEAQRSGDERTALRLEDLLSAARGRGFPGGVGYPDERADGGIESMLEAALAQGGNDQLFDLMRKQLGNDVFDELRRSVGGSATHFAAALLKLLADVGLPAAAANASAAPRRQSAPRSREHSVDPQRQRDLFDD